VTERRVPEVMREADRLRQHFVELERAGDGAGNLRHLERVGEARAKQVALMIDEHLGLVNQAAKGGGVDDAVAITLVFRAIGRSGFGVAPAARQFIAGRIGGQSVQPKYPASVASSASRS
jgi:hypothetical protein